MLRREALLFAAGGLIGLLIDAGVVQLLVTVLRWNPYAARLLSFVLAASFTWGWNRRYTFAGHVSGHPPHREWMHWMALMGAGALVNYGVYALALMLFPLLQWWPAVAVAGGSAVAAALNFSAARGMLFRKPRSEL